MISVITSIVGGLVFVLGLVWAVVAWVSKPQGQQIIRTIDALTPGDLSKFIPPVQTPSQDRQTALSQADSLFAYFEAKKSESGLKATREAIASIFETKAEK